MPDRRSYLRLATAANVADINMLGELLHGDEESLSRIRATVEHSFLVVKRLWGHGKVVGGVRMAPCQEPDEFREARRRLCRCCSSFLRRSRAYPI
jgi:hypothetical protein